MTSAVIAPGARRSILTPTGYVNGRVVGAGNTTVVLVLDSGERVEVRWDQIRAERTK